MNRKKVTDNRGYEKKIAVFEAFKQHEGYCNVPRDHQELGLWVNNQRDEYREFKARKSSLMTDERVKLLKAVGFQFDPRDAKYEEKTTQA